MAETAVVGFPHPVKGEGVYAYIVVKESAMNMTHEEKEKMRNELKAMVKKKISGFAAPEMIQVRTSCFKYLHHFWGSHSTTFLKGNSCFWLIMHI